MIVLHKQCNLNFQERTGFFFTVYLNSYIIVAIWENSDGQTDAPLSLELKFYRASILIVIIHISYLILRLLFSRTRVLVWTLWAYILLFILIYWTRASNKSRIYFYTFKFMVFFLHFHTAEALSAGLFCVVQSQRLVTIYLSITYNTCNKHLFCT